MFPVLKSVPDVWIVMKANYMKAREAMSRVLVNTKDMARQEWLKWRRAGIGGSDAGAIIGLNPYATPYTVWADKTGRLPEKEDNEAMRQGRDLESYVVHRFEEATGKKCKRRNQMLQHDKYDFAVANIDREVIGEKAGLECKTTSIMNLKKFKNGEFPDQYYAQCVHYLAVTGWDKWYLAVLILNQGFRVFEIERDEEEINALLEAEKEFWEDFVEKDEAPALDGYKPTSEAISQIYEGGSDEVVQLYCPTILEQRAELVAQIKALEQEKEKCEQVIKESMKDAERAECEGYKISWAKQSRKSFDAKKYAADNPDIDLEPYYKTSEFRAFKISKLKTASK